MSAGGYPCSGCGEGFSANLGPTHRRSGPASAAPPAAVGAPADACALLCSHGGVPAPFLSAAADGFATGPTHGEASVGPEDGGEGQRPPPSALHRWSLRGVLAAPRLCGGARVCRWWWRQCWRRVPSIAEAGSRLTCRRVVTLSVVVVCAAVVVVVVVAVAGCRFMRSTPLDAATAVVVQYEYAARLLQGKAPHLVTPAQLPSWTLRVVPAECGGCLDVDAHGVAVRQAAAGIERVRWMEFARSQVGPLPPPPTAAELSSARAADMVRGRGGLYGVFATENAALGRIGPMLLAMCSVTDDVDAAAELPRWGWLRHVQTFAAPNRFAAPAPYVAVAGSLSSAQEQAVSLRRAQRATWVRYSAVARNDNDFHGRLLHLYVVAGADFIADRRVPQLVPHDTGPALHPTVGEFANATAYYEAMAAASKGNGGGGAGVTGEGLRHVTMVQRRVALRTDWRTVEDSTPACSHVYTSRQHGSVTPAPAPPSLMRLAEHLHLPIAPAATSVARLVCNTPAAVWREALDYRDVVWVDIAAARVPPAHAERGEWGEAGEAGTTQKTVLWLYYAYHAFPTVPFILKCDDDTYVKVPQLVSDLGYLLTGWRSATASPSGSSAAASSFSTEAPTQAEDFAGPHECVYGGAPIAEADVDRTPARIFYTLSHQAARVLLEEPGRGLHTGRLTSVLHDFVVPLSHSDVNAYDGAPSTAGAAVVRDVLRGRHVRGDARCAAGRVRFVVEGPARHHELRDGVFDGDDAGADADAAAAGVVTWASTVVQRVAPAHFSVLHYFFTMEQQLVRNGTGHGDGGHEKAARRTAMEWGRARLRTSTDAGGEDAPALQWLPRNAKPSLVEVVDGVGVHNITYNGRGRRPCGRVYEYSEPYGKRVAGGDVVVE